MEIRIIFNDLGYLDYIEHAWIASLYLANDQLWPDLAITNLTTPLAVEAGVAFKVPFGVANQGFGPTSKPFVQQVYFAGNMLAQIIDEKT